MEGCFGHKTVSSKPICQRNYENVTSNIDQQATLYVCTYGKFDWNVRP